MVERLDFVVDGPGIRLDRFLAERSQLSRSHLQKLIAEGQVLLNGQPVKPSQKVMGGDVISVSVPPPVPISVAPEDIPLQVVYEDSDLVVIDKPAGLTVHPGPGHRAGTLVNALLSRCPDLASIRGSVRPGIVHRLDKDTSGLMVVAKNDAAHLSLSAQIKQRAVKKGYLVLVHGRVVPREGAIDAPIGRHPRDRKRMAVVSGGREARTEYRVDRHFEDCALLEVSTKTGRTHQIRVHLSAIGHPVVGDAVYGRKSELLPRQFLHAHRLGFRLPGNGEFVEFESGLPPDLRRVLTLVETTGKRVF